MPVSEASLCVQGPGAADSSHAGEESGLAAAQAVAWVGLKCRDPCVAVATAAACLDEADSRSACWLTTASVH